MRFIWKATSALAWSVLGGIAILVLIGVWYLQNRPDLKIWHSTYLDTEFTEASNIGTFADYLALEQVLFNQLDEEIIKKLPAKDKSAINRFTPGSLSDPKQWAQNWNHSFVLPGSGPGVLLLHGMSDSPYSLRTIGSELHSQGFSVLGLRLPGHGTAPSGLVRVEWEDMAAAVRLAMKHLHQSTNGKPLYIVGYSNGAALAVNYALAAIQDPDIPKPSALALISPQIQITAAAALAKWQSLLGQFFDLGKLAWNSLQPEYDPYKYNSFAVNAGQQSFEITQEIQAKLTDLRERKKLGEMPKILAFQSVADATIIASGIIQGLLQRLPQANHQLVLFDINRQSKSLNTILNDPLGAIEKTMEKPEQPFALTLVTNRTGNDDVVIARRRKPEQAHYEDTALSLEWPADVFSLSHVALPFSWNDPLYGIVDDGNKNRIRLGRLDLRGERGVLQIPPADILRQRWNPFYKFLATEISTFLKKDRTKPD